MRVIGGSFRSRILVAPPGQGTRPTSDRLRETLFNVLGPRVVGARVLDLYSGTGAVGIEAMSRGAVHVTFVERAPPAVRALRANLQALGIASGVDVLERPVAAVLERLAATPPASGFDFTFLDPPYESVAEYVATLSVLGGAAGEALLAAGALVVAEHATRTPLAERYGALLRVRTLRQGDATLSFFRRRDVESQPAS